jgi:hypothetical protein
VVQKRSGRFAAGAGLSGPFVWFVDKKHSFTRLADAGSNSRRNSLLHRNSALI